MDGNTNVLPTRFEYNDTDKVPSDVISPLAAGSSSGSPGFAGGFGTYFVPCPATSTPLTALSPDQDAPSNPPASPWDPAASNAGVSYWGNNFPGSTWYGFNPVIDANATIPILNLSVTTGGALQGIGGDAANSLGLDNGDFDGIGGAYNLGQIENAMAGRNITAPMNNDVIAGNWDGGFALDAQQAWYTLAIVQPYTYTEPGGNVVAGLEEMRDSPATQCVIAGAAIAGAAFTAGGSVIGAALIESKPIVSAVVAGLGLGAALTGIAAAVQADFACIIGIAQGQVTFQPDANEAAALTWMGHSIENIVNYVGSAWYNMEPNGPELQSPYGPYSNPSRAQKVFNGQAASHGPILSNAQPAALPTNRPAMTGPSGGVYHSNASGVFDFVAGLHTATSHSLLTA